MFTLVLCEYDEGHKDTLHYASLHVSIPDVCCSAYEFVFSNNYKANNLNAWLVMASKLNEMTFSLFVYLGNLQT